MLFVPLSGSSLMHRMDERLLFASYVMYQIILVLSTAPALLLALLLLAVVAGRLGVSPGRFLLSTGRFLLLLLFFAAIPPVSALLTGGTPIPAATESGLLLLRLAGLLLSAHIMLGILSPEGVSRVLRWASAPFGAVGRTFSVMVVALFAILPRLEEIIREEREARRLRGPGLGGPLQRIRTTLYSLLREGVLEADTLTEAFMLRGFNLSEEQGNGPFRGARGQWIPPIVVVALGCAAVVTRLYLSSTVWPE